VEDQLVLSRKDAARADSARAAQLQQVITTQRRIMDSLASSQRALRTTMQSNLTTLKGDLASDLYNIQQQLVQLQELTGQSQQRLTELRARLEARGAEIESAPAPGDTAAPIGGGTTSASADQMYEASLAQLRRGSLSTARLGLRKCLGPSSSERAPDALYFIGQSYASENPDSAAAYYGQVAEKYLCRPGRRRRCTTWGCWRNGEAIPRAPGRRSSAWCSPIPNPTKPRWLVTD
jgi:TolA-binding protein